MIQYFSNTSSCLSLQDFYSTLPHLGENPIDYWIRLNKAADMAEEGLERQGRHMYDMGGEIAKMFVKHCPDLTLASVFKYKQIHEWTSKEIQERIDEHQRERVSSFKANVPKTQKAAFFCNDAHAEFQNRCTVEMPTDISPPPLVHSHGVEAPPSHAPVLSQNQQHSFSPVHLSQQPYLPPLLPAQQLTVSP